MVEGLVSTIIPVYNRPKMLMQSVESVLAQTYRPIEIIISDDGSIDETPQVAQKLCSKHPEIVYIRNENKGPGPAREAGRLVAKGEFIQYLDSDDLLLPQKFEIQVESLRTHPECGVSYGKTRLVDMSGKVLADPFKWTAKKTSSLFPQLLVDRWWCTHTPLYRRSVCDAIGPWTDLRYSQDWEYDGRVGALSTKLIWCDKTVSEHRTHECFRQTGDGTWLAPPDRVRFFKLLFQHARTAGVELAAPEMKHFARWIFLNVRQCGKLDDGQAARQLFELAVRANNGASGDMHGYALLASLLGWERSAHVTEWLHGCLKKTPGKLTRKQSWMRSDD